MIRKFLPSHLQLAETNTISNNEAGDTTLPYYLNFCINDINYSFASPVDSISYDDNANAVIYFQNAAATKFGWLHFRTQTPYYAGAVEVFDPGTGTGLLLYENSDSGYPVSITEYGDPGEYISGHYSGIYTDATNDPIYNFSCSFRIRRNK